MKKLSLSTFVVLLTLTIGVAYASEACFYGTAVNGDGSKIDGTCAISTSWNGEKAFPRKGEFRLCPGSNPEKTITIYVDGKKYTTLHVDGNTRLDIVRR